MLTKMTGILNRVLDEEVRLQIGPLEYQILVPEMIRRQIQTQTGNEITFFINEFIEGNQNSNRLIPRRLGFLTETELEFFDLICTVDRIGVRKALRAMARPIREIAEAIQRQDSKWLSTLPGIGKQSAEQVIATLKTKVTKYALMRDTQMVHAADMKPGTGIDPQMFDDAYAALMSLGMNPMDARTRLDEVIQKGIECKSVQDILTKIFQPSESKK